MTKVLTIHQNRYSYDAAYIYKKGPVGSNYRLGGGGGGHT